jgi:hypothetical protein
VRQQLEILGGGAFPGPRQRLTDRDSLLFDRAVAGVDPTSTNLNAERSCCIACLDEPHRDIAFCRREIVRVAAATGTWSLLARGPDRVTVTGLGAGVTVWWRNRRRTPQPLQTRKRQYPKNGASEDSGLMHAWYGLYL